MSMERFPLGWQRVLLLVALFVMVLAAWQRNLGAVVLGGVFAAYWSLSITFDKGRTRR